MEGIHPHDIGTILDSGKESLCEPDTIVRSL